MKDRDDIVCLSHLRWGFVYQRPNHIMSRFAKQRRVLFVEEPHFDGERGPEIRVEEVAPQLFVCTPVLPESLRDHSDETVRSLLQDLLAARCVSPPVMWMYSPMFWPIAAELPRSLLVYDCMDELSAFAGAAPELIDRERQVFQRADLVFTGGRSLYESKRSQHAAVHCFPSSVDASHFGPARSACQEPSDQANIPHPRIGYYGVIDERIDLALLADLAAARPDYHFVMVGPLAKIDAASLPRAENLHFLGGKKYGELPAYLAGWDVAMMPFALNDATRFISPTKTLEYMAAAKPIVSTAVADVVDPYGQAGLVHIADARTFARAVDAVLSPNPVYAARCDEVLCSTSWDATHARMDALMRHAVGNKKHAFMAKEAGTPCSTT